MTDKERDIKDLCSNGSSLSDSFDDHNYGPKDQCMMSLSEDRNQSMHLPCWPRARIDPLPNLKHLNI